MSSGQTSKRPETEDAAAGRESEGESSYSGGRYTAVVGQSEWPEERVGGKANGLHKLDSVGFATPEAFCVTTDAFDRVVDECVDGAESLDELRERIAEAKIPADIVDEISECVEQIGADAWAIRSSSVEEDSPEHSFAGQQQSVLNVDSLDEMLAAIKEVWASLYKVEGLLYRTRLRVGLEPASMAVVVQRMVEPEVTGVMFTENPVSGDPNQIVINAGSSDQTAVVAGGPADAYYLEKQTGYVERHEYARRDEDGGDERNDLLSRIELDDLAGCARRLDRHFDRPQDVEWALAPGSKAEAESGLGRRLYILQTRPITGRSADDVSASVWTNVNVGEALPGVATPLTWSIIHEFSRKGFERAFGSLGLSVPEDVELAGSFRGRVYLNLTQFMTIASAIPLLEPETLFGMAGGGGVELVREVYEQRSAGEFLKRLPVTIPRAVLSQISMPFVAPLWSAYFGEKRDDFFHRDLGRLNHSRFCDVLDEVDTIFDRTGLVMLAGSSNFLMSYVVMEKTLELLGGPEAVQSERELVSALEVDSAQPGLDLLDLGRVARRSRRLREIITSTPADETLETIEEWEGEADVDLFLDALRDFRETHGHRAPREAELSTPRWREDTSFLFEVVKGYVESSHLPTERQLETEREHARERVDEIVETTFPPGFELLFRGLLKFTRHNARIRETLRTRVVETLDMYRKYFLECGRRLVEIDAIRASDDVFYLRYDEIRDWLDDPAAADGFHLRVLVRRALHSALSDLPDPPGTFVLEDGEMIAESDYLCADADRSRVDVAEGHGVEEIRGLPACSGKVTGRARVIRDPNVDARLEPGEILVAPYTDVGWTPLFLTASAVVMGLGGPLSHSSIVAREYGIPTVVNAHGICDRIETGDVITVDGDQGVVYVRERAADVQRSQND